MNKSIKNPCVSVGRSGNNKKIIPLFSTPLQLKQIKLKKNKLSNKIININEILNIYLRGINIYNNTLNNLLINNNKLKLIRELKYDEYNKLNIVYNNYLYILNRYLPIFKFISLKKKLQLFVIGKNIKKRILIYNNIFKYTYRLRSLYLRNNKYKYIKNINIKYIRMVSKLLYKGDILYLYIVSLINKKKSIINNYKLNNLLEPVNSLILLQINKKTLLNIYKEIQEINNYDNLLNLNFKNLLRNNEIQVYNTRKSIYKYLNFNNRSDYISNNNIYIPAQAIPLGGQAGQQSLNTSVKREGFSALQEGEVGQTNNYNGTKNTTIINQYLKEMSKFNMNRKGIFIYYNNIIGFNFNNYTNKLIKNIYKLLFTSFKSMYCLISRPVFVISPDIIKIQLFYYLFVPNLLKIKQLNLYKKNKKYKIYNIRELKKKHYKFKIGYNKFRRKQNKINLYNLSSNAITKVFSNKFNILCNILSNLFKKPVELNITRLHYPYFDSNILVNLLGIMINKIKLRIIFRKLFANKIIKNLNKINLYTFNNSNPAFLSGINIKVAGRLLTQRVVPRKTVKTIIRGASARSKVNFLDVGRYTNKNRRGAFSITVKSGQNYY